MAHRGKLDHNRELVQFCLDLEQVCIETVESGKMTKDLAIAIHGDKVSRKDYQETMEHLETINANLQKKRGLKA